MARPTPLPVPCEAVREAVSARLDDEGSPIAAVTLTAHLRVCAACARFEATAGAMARRTRVAAVQAVPNLTAPILVALDEQRIAPAGRRRKRLRALVGLAGAAQLVIAIAALAGRFGPDLHAGRELGALQLALGVGLVLAAWQPRRGPGVLPILAVLAVVTLVTAVVDVRTGAASVTGELVHLVELIGVLALWGLVRGLPDVPRIRDQVTV